MSTDPTADADADAASTPPPTPAADATAASTAVADDTDDDEEEEEEEGEEEAAAPPTTLPGGYRVGDEVFYTGEDYTFPSGLLVYGDKGEVGAYTSAAITRIVRALTSVIPLWPRNRVLPRSPVSCLC